MSRKVHSTWTEVQIHTAKCDRCNKHNKAILYRCSSCGFQICTPCREADPDDGEHTMNGGERPRRPRLSVPLLGRHSSDASSLGEPSQRQEKKKRRRTFGTDKEDLDGDWEVIVDTQRQIKRRDIRTDESTAMSDTRSAFKASDNISTAADHLLRVALGLDHPPFLSPGIDSNPLAAESDGISALLQAAAQMENSAHTTPIPLSTVPDTEGESGPEAQARSPLFFRDDEDMEIDGDDIAEGLERRVDEEGWREGIRRYEFAGELVEMKMRCERPAEGRLRGLYRRALVVRGADGKRVRSPGS